MGSQFFKAGMNPMSMLDIPGRLAGNNSWLARMTSYDPVMQTGVGKVLAPNAYSRGQAYSQRHSPPPGYQPSYGGDASLSGANAGYVNAAGQFGQPQNQTPQRTVTQGGNPAIYGY